MFFFRVPDIIYWAGQKAEPVRLVTNEITMTISESLEMTFKKVGERLGDPTIIIIIKYLVFWSNYLF